MALGVTETLDVLYHNAAKARYLLGLLKEMPRISVEIGPGPWGFGINGFLRDIPIRFCAEPDPRLELDTFTAHTYRMFEPDVLRRLKAAGFSVLHRKGHSLLSLCIGHFRISTLLLCKED